MSSHSKKPRSIKSIRYNIADKNKIIENALKKRKSVKEYRENQEELIKKKNEIFEKELRNRRQSQLDNISKTRKNKKSNNNEKGFFERIKSRFTQKSKSKHSKSKSKKQA